MRSNEHARSGELGYPIDTTSTGVIIIVSVIVSIACILLAWRYIGTMSGSDLRVVGIPAQATILKLWDTGTTMNDHLVAGMLLDVQSPDQPSYQVETKSIIARLSIGQLQIGTVVRVKIDPTNTKRIVLDLYAA